MRIKLIVQASDRDTRIAVDGDTITVDGTDYDLSAVPEGGEGRPVTRGHPFFGAIRHEDGQIGCAVKYCYDSRTATLHQPADPDAYIFDIAAGPVPDPIQRRES